jgi:hypothetical protein
VSGEVEEWRPCVGGLYEVSDLGRVRRAASGKGTRPGRMRALRIAAGTGYPFVSVADVRAGKKRNRAIHRLVAEAFLGPCPPGYEVNHKNGDKLDARPVNLEYVSPSDNLRHAYRAGLRKAAPVYGEAHGRSKLTSEEVEAVRRESARGATQRAIAAKFGVHQGTIWSIVNGHTRASG